MSMNNENKIKMKNINLDESEIEDDEIDGAFGQNDEKEPKNEELLNSKNNENDDNEEENEEENENNEEDDDEEDQELSEDNNEENEEKDISEEMVLKNEIENVDFKSLLKAKAKLSYEDSKKDKNKNDKKKFNKNSIKMNLEKINKNKKKYEPKEFSALIRPKYEKENRNIFQKNSSLLHKKFSRDPRFDDLSGNLNEEKFKKNFGFVNDMAKDYINKLNMVKKSKKFKKKLNEQQYELLKKQNNYVKSWMNQQKQKNERDEIRKEINKENKERISKGQKPIYINQNKMNKYFKNKNKENQK